MKVVLLLLVCSVVLVDLIHGGPGADCDGKACDGNKGGKDGKSYGGGGNKYAQIEYRLKYLQFKIAKLSQQIENIPINLYRFKQIYHGGNYGYGNKNYGGKNYGGKNWGGKNDGGKNWGGKNDGGENWGGKNDGGENWGGKNDGGENWSKGKK